MDPEQINTTKTRRPIKRPQILALSVALGLGLAWFVSLDYAQTITTILPLILLVSVGCFWVMHVPFSFRPDLYPLYASFILPVTLYTSLLFFLREFTSLQITITLSILSIPTWYLLFLSLSALEKYRKLPNHMSRVVLNLLTLTAGYISTASLYRYQLPLWLVVLSIWAIMWLLFFQSILWWTNGSLRYSLLYASIAATVLAGCSIPLYLWPTGYLLLGFVVLLLQYNLMGIIQHYFKRKLTKGVISEYLLMTLVVAALVFSQTNWFPDPTS